MILKRETKLILCLIFVTGFGLAVFFHLITFNFSYSEAAGITGKTGVVNVLPGWGGGIAYNPDKNQYMIVAQGVDQSNGAGDAAMQPWMRILDNNGKPVTSQLHIEKGKLTAWEGAPAVAYSTRDKRYLVVWYGNFKDKVGTLLARFYTNAGKPEGAIFDANASMNEAMWAENKLIYDAVNNNFVYVYEARPTSGNIVTRLVRIGNRGQAYPVIKLTKSTIQEDRGPILAVNPGKEYCVPSVRTPGSNETIKDNSLLLRRIDARTGSVSNPITVEKNVGAMSMIYNPDRDEYLLAYHMGLDSYGAIIKNCNRVISKFKIRSSGGMVLLGYNSKSKMYGVLGGEQNSAANFFIQMSPTGKPIFCAAVFSDVPLNGNFTSGIAANTRDGTFAITSSQDYTLMRFIGGLYGTSATGNCSAGQ